MDTTVIFLDGRRRTSLAKVGHKEHAQYVVEEHADGSLTLIPAVTIPLAELKVLADPKLRAALDEAKNPDWSKGHDRGSFAQHAEPVDDEASALRH